MKKQIAQKTKKPLRRILSAILALCVFCTALPFTALNVQAADDTTYTSGDYEYRILEDGTVEITDYTGNVTNLTIPGELDGYKVTRIGYYAFGESYWIKHIILPDGLTIIGEYAFCRSTILESIIIPNTVTSIGRSAFLNCSSLDNVVIPNSVISIGDYAFQDCQLKHLTLNDELRSIGYRAFWGCSVENLIIPDSVMSIGDSAFGYCKELEDVVIQADAASIGNSAFENCSALKNVILQDGITSIGNKAFQYCSALNSITIPGSVISIGESAFNVCSALEKVVIEAGVTSIGQYAFIDCNINSITIPVSVTEIGKYALFYASDNQSNVYYSGSLEQWKQISIGSGNDFSHTIFHYESVGPSSNADDLQNGSVTLYAYDKSAIELDTLASLGNTKLSGVTLTTGGKSEEFDEFVAVTDDGGTSQTVLSKPGYRDYIIPVDVMNSWFDAAQENGYLQRNTYLDNAPANGDPYVSAVFARSAGEGAYRDVMSQSFTASKGEKYDVILSANLAGEEDAAYYLWQDDEHMLMNSTGVFAGWELASVFAPGVDVYAYVQTNSGKVSEREELQLSITDLSLPKDEISLVGKDGQSVKVDKDSKILGGAKFSLDAFKLPIGVEITGNHFKFSFGFDIFNLETDSTTVGSETETKTEENWASFKKYVSKLQKDVDEGTAEMQRYLAMFKDKNPSELKNKNTNFDFSVLGYAEGNIVGNNIVVTDFGGKFSLEFMFKYIQQALLGPVPVYGTWSVGANATAIPSYVVYTQDLSIPFDFGLTIELEPKFELGVGAGIKNVASVGAYGKGSFPMSFEFTDKHFQMNAKGEFGFEAEAFVFKGQLPLLRLDDGEINLIDYYFNRSSKRYSYALPAFGESVTVQPAPSSGKAAYSVADRSYLQNMSGWLDKGVLKRLTRAVAASSPEEGVQMRELQTSVYKNSSTQLIKLDDGRMMMAWIEDDPNRDDLNRMRLVYSVYNAGSWSEPKAVADDGTNDNTPVLATDGETVYVAWQNIKSKTTAADEAAVQQLLQDSEICLAKYNAEEDAFEPAVQLSDNALYDSTPAIAVENGNAAVYWVTATTSDMTKPGNNQIRCYTTSDGKTRTVQDNVNNVLSMDSAFVNGQPQLAYSADTDGDVSTTEDIETFVVNGNASASVSAQDDTPDLYLDYGELDGEDVLFFADSTNIYYQQNGETKSVFTSPRVISGELQAVSDNGNTSLLWAESSEEGTDLWMCSYENGAWTEPVQLTSAGKYLHDVSAVYQDGQLCAVLDRTNRLPTEDGGYENGTTDLVYMTMTEYTEIEAGFAALDESQMELGQTYGVPVYIKNNGTKTVDTVKVTLSDGGLLPGVSKEIQVNLPSGADTVVYVDYPVPAEMVRTLFELSVEVVGETEQNTEDNTASQQIGYADISMQDMTVEDVGNYYILTAVLSNDNAVVAPGVQVNICAGSKDGDVLDTLTVGDMQPGDLKSVQYIVDKSTLDYGEEGCSRSISVHRSSRRLRVLQMRMQQN